MPIESDRTRSATAIMRSAAIVIASIGAGPLTAACSGGSSGPGVANLGSTTTTAVVGAPQGSSKGTELQYSQCMRTHGIRDFPDPNAQGQIALTGGPGSDLNPADAVFQTAERACATTSFKPVSTQSEQAQYTTELLRFAQCVRAQGVVTFPDPSNLGPNQGVGFVINRHALDPHSAGLQAAETACKRTLPTGRSQGFKSTG